MSECGLDECDAFGGCLYSCGYRPIKVLKAKKVRRNYHIPINDSNINTITQLVESAIITKGGKFKVRELYAEVEIEDYQPKFQECNSKGYE